MPVEYNTGTLKEGVGIEVSHGKETNKPGKHWVVCLSINVTSLRRFKNLNQRFLKNNVMLSCLTPSTGNQPSSLGNLSGETD